MRKLLLLCAMHSFVCRPDSMRRSVLRGKINSSPDYNLLNKFDCSDFSCIFVVAFNHILR